jgi:hypothetical protein
MWKSEGRSLEIRQIDASGNPVAPGVTYDPLLLKYLLRARELYGSAAPQPIPPRFDWIVTFSSGFCRPSSIKPRIFKEMDGYTNQPTGRIKPFGRLAHDVVIELDVKKGGRVEVSIDGKAVWNSADHSDSRFDLEIISPHSSAENYFRDAIDHQGKNYWVPNQGDPDPMGWP